MNKHKEVFPVFVKPLTSSIFGCTSVISLLAPHSSLHIQATQLERTLISQSDSLLKPKIMFSFFKSKPTQRFTPVDCHSHLLPGVDDGVRTLDEALRILAEMERLGVERLWLTPHIMEDIPNTTADLRDRFRQVCDTYHGTIELNLAAEYMLDNLFAERLAADDLLPLTEGKRYLLVETSYFNAPMNLHALLEDIKKRGYYPLLAHPERYEYMTMADYRQLKSQGIAFQLNLPSLAGSYGSHVKKKAEQLMKQGLYELYGTDTHRFAK